MNEIIISILLPIKNSALWIEDCLDSILNQNFNRWELMAVDDHSTDQSLQIVQDYALSDVRIKSFVNSGYGIIDALRQGFHASQGSYITRMDSDDIMDTKKLSLLHSRLTVVGRNHVAIGGVTYFSQGVLGNGYKRYAEWLNELTTLSANFTEIYKECVIPSPCWLIHRLDLIACGAFDAEVYPEDYDLCFRMYQQGFKIAGLDTPIHFWRDHAERTSRNDVRYADNRFLALKISYFMEIDYREEKTLVVWGAGKKGKIIAKQLNENHIDFHWVTNNKNKIGQNIYGKLILDCAIVSKLETCQVILFVANPAHNKAIKQDIESFNYSCELFSFC